MTLLEKQEAYLHNTRYRYLLMRSWRNLTEKEIDLSTMAYENFQNVRAGLGFRGQTQEQAFEKLSTYLTKALARLQKMNKTTTQKQALARLSDRTKNAIFLDLIDEIVEEALEITRD